MQMEMKEGMEARQKLNNLVPTLSPKEGRGFCTE